MSVQPILGVFVLVLGIITLAVGVAHFAIMGTLGRMILRQLDPQRTELVIGSFRVNHIASGVLVLLVGAILVYASLFGLQRGEQWALVICLLTGLALIALSLLIWATIPRFFMQSPIFVPALASLTGVGVSLVIAALVFWSQFG